MTVLGRDNGVVWGFITDCFSKVVDYFFLKGSKVVGCCGGF